MSKFHFKYIIKMKDIVRDGDSILHQPTEEVELPLSKEDRDALICMMNYVKTVKILCFQKYKLRPVLVYPQTKSVSINECLLPISKMNEALNMNIQ